MLVWAVDFIGFLLLCVGSRLATPRILRLFCRIAALYILVFAVGYYFWLRPQYHYFQTHPHFFQDGILMAFRFEGFWRLLGNMILLQGLGPVALLAMLYFGIKWLVTLPRSNIRQ